jgi:cell wall-associated NlpC family hydrolase
MNLPIGTPWRLYGMSPDTGFSCYGFVRWYYAELGIVLPPEIQDAADLTQSLVQASSWFTPVDPPYAPLDLLVFRNVGSLIRHLGVLLDPRTFAHCCPATNGVARSPLERWRRYLRHASRLKPEHLAGATSCS